ncbi:tetratricopeptide repeat protein [Pseudonocardia xishanensis]|uniref:tetratricopeptide repeat protein n=1 Tax=Pseudonocardia xishanensis TaxID=630995 RepID=UPI0031F0887D
MRTVCRPSSAPEHARRYLEHGLEHARAAGDRWGESLALTGLGMVRHTRGDLAGATNCLRQAITLAHEVGDRWWERLATTALGRVHTALGDHVKAATHHGKSLEAGSRPRRQGRRSRRTGRPGGMTAWVRCHPR